MAEFTNVAAQTVAANGNVVFSNTAVKGSNCIQHREGSGIITLRGLTNQCKARFFVDFSGNIAIPTGGTVGAISLAIAISGEPVLSSQMISTPAAGSAADIFRTKASAFGPSPWTQTESACSATVLPSTAHTVPGFAICSTRAMASSSFSIIAPGLPRGTRVPSG